MKSLLSVVKRPLVCVLAVALVGLPNAPVASQLPGTGGDACADESTCYGGHGNDDTGCVEDWGNSKPADDYCDAMADVAIIGSGMLFAGAVIAVVPGGQLAGGFVAIHGAGTLLFAMIAMRWQDCI